MIVWENKLYFILKNKKFLKNAISHKELSAFLTKAKKDVHSHDPFTKNNIKEKQEFDYLIKNWTETSQKILQMMNNNEKILSNNRNPKSIMAYGAMGAHINMALIALKATESDQWSLNVCKFITYGIKTT